MKCSNQHAMLEIFTSVDASWPGSVHDNRIQNNVPINNAMCKTSDAALLGGEGYGFEPWFMMPFKNQETEEQKSFKTIFKK